MALYKVEFQAFGYVIQEADTPEQAENLVDDEMVLPDLSDRIVWTDFEFGDEFPSEY